jgi:hypothetical protein
MIIAAFIFVACLVNCYSDRFLPNRINVYWSQLNVHLLESVVLEFDHYLVIYVFFSFEIGISASGGLGLGTNSRAPFSSFTKLLLVWKSPLKSFIPLYRSLNILVLTGCCRFINFVFQIFPFFNIPEISAGFTSYIQFIPIYFTLII